MSKEEEVKKILEEAKDCGLLMIYDDKDGTVSSEISRKIVKLFSPPPVAGDLREKIASQIMKSFEILCNDNSLEGIEPELNPTHSMFAHKLADSILALIDIDKMARERGWISPNEAKALQGDLDNVYRDISKGKFDGRG